MVSSSARFFNGLLTRRLHPTSFARRTASASADAVKAIIGVGSHPVRFSRQRISRTRGGAWHRLAIREIVEAAAVVRRKEERWKWI